MDRLIATKVRNGFAAVRAQGVEEFRASIDDGPGGVLALANHSCWWDLFLAHALNEAIPADGYGMMEHFNLRRFGFFRRIGAFSVDRTDPRSVRESLDHAAELLRRPRSLVWIFPQGTILANDHRPLSFQAGLRALIRRAGRLRIATVALRYEFWQEERPEALVRFGIPSWVDRSSGDDAIDDWQSRLTAELDTLRDAAISQDPARFTTLIAGPRSINDRYARLRELFVGRRPGEGPPE